MFLASHKDITHTKMAELSECEMYDSGEFELRSLLETEYGTFCFTYSRSFGRSIPRR